MNDVAHLLISDDGITGRSRETLLYLQLKGIQSVAPMEHLLYYIDKGKWYLFYERNDEAIWLATSVDLITWINIQDEPFSTKVRKHTIKGPLP